MLRYVDWIWHVRGSLALAPGQSVDEAFEKLDPLFHQPGTSHERADDVLTFQKKDPMAQDKMSVFDSGVLAIENQEGRWVLWYQLRSPTLLFCFMLPLLFAGIAQLTIEVGKRQKPSVESVKKPEKVAENPMHPLDKALGAPAPENKTKAEKEKDKIEKEKAKFSPTPAYVFAGIFAFLYLVGRILEDRLIRALFRRRLTH